MEMCKRKKTEIPGWVLPVGMMVFILLIIGGYRLGYYSYSPAKKPADEVTAKSEAVVAETKNYTIIEIEPNRMYMIKSLKLVIDGRDVTGDLIEGSRELAKRFYPEYATAINQYDGRTIALVVLVTPKNSFKELLRKDMEPSTK